jgi:uncharacterized protein with FMN-binding domain
VKRYPVVIGVTVAGLAGVLTFHSHNGTLSLRHPTSSSGTGSATPAGSTRRTAPTTRGQPSSSSSSQGTTTSSAAGTLEQYGYGQLSVRVSMVGGKITGLAIATLQTADTYSQQLASSVIPVLQREVLSAQSARISGVSGATYTSEAYAYSVQSAIDKLHR